MKPLKAQFQKSPSFWVILLFALAGLLMRVWAGYSSQIGRDEYRLVNQALEWVLDGRLSKTGAAVVYSGTALPGSLQPLLFGFPLFIARLLDLKLGLTPVVVWLSLLNTVAAWILFLWIKRMASRMPSPPSLWFLAIVCFFSPWSVWFQKLWNPTLLPIFAAIFFSSYSSAFPENLPHTERLRSKTPYLLLGATVTATLQLHLSFILLIIPLFFAFALKWRGRSKTHRFVSQSTAFFYGCVLGGLTLFPWLLDSGTSEAVTHQPSRMDWITKNIEVDFVGKLSSFFVFLSRLWTFPSSEIFRFIGPQGGGFQGALGFAHSLGFWGILFFWSAALSAAISTAVTAYGWWTARPKSINDLGSPTRFLIFFLPLLSGATFLFSIKSPSAHTFWILQPIAILSFTLGISRLDSKKKKVVATTWALGAAASFGILALWTLRDGGIHTIGEVEKRWRRGTEIEVNEETKLHLQLLRRIEATTDHPAL
jgi:hypothetical protein